MSFYVGFLVTFIATIYGVTSGQPYGEVRMDNDPMYFSHQDIVKAFNRSQKQWLYGTNFPLPETFKNYDCIKFIKDGLSDQEMNFTAFYLQNNETYLKRLIGKFYTVPNELSPPEQEQRDRPNGIIVSGTPGTQSGTDFRLIYSNYHNCSILRVPSKLAGGGCIVLLTVTTVKKGLPYFCNTTYHNACGKQRTFYKVFNETCQLTADPSGCWINCTADS